MFWFYEHCFLSAAYLIVDVLKYIFFQSPGIRMVWPILNLNSGNGTLLEVIVMAAIIDTPIFLSILTS